MDQFEQAMTNQGVPAKIIDMVKTSPVWINQFQNYTQVHVDALIYLFPMIYHTVKWIPTEKEIADATKNYAPMDTSA